MDENKKKSSLLRFLKIGILLIGDVIVAIGASSFSWYLRSVSNLGIFGAVISPDAFQRIPYHLWFIVLSQVFSLYMAGSYTTERRPKVKRIVVRTCQALFIQIIFLSIFYLLSAGPGKYPFSILPLFLVSNILFCITWRILALRGILIRFTGMAESQEYILTPEEEGMGVLEKCNLLLSKAEELSKRKDKLEGSIEELEKKVSSEDDRKELSKLLRALRYHKRERGRTVRDLIELKLKVRSELEPVKREKRRAEKRLNWLKKKVLIQELEKEIVEGFPEEEYFSQRRELGRKTENEEKEIERLSKVVDSYGEAFFGKLASSFRLYFEYLFLIKLKVPYKVVEFFGKDFARLFIVAFMVLLVSCAFLLIFKKEKAAEEVANVAYFSLVIGVVMELVLMIKQRKPAGHRIKDNARSRR